MSNTPHNETFTNTIMTTFNENSRIADIILQNFNQVLLLEHLSIPLMVQGKTVKEICKEYNISIPVYLAFVDLYNGQGIPSGLHIGKDDTLCLINFLRNSHRYYLEDKIPQIKEYVQRISQTGQSSGIKLLSDFTNDYIQELREHFEYEDKIVFPYVLALNKGESYKGTYSITEYKSHHENVDSKLADLKELLVKYLYFKDEEHLRCKLLCCLFEMEYDLKIHSHIEDFVLIPLVERLEHTDGKATSSKDDSCQLSQREIDVLKCLIEGKSNKEVADTLFISTHTVVSHRKNISEKTGIKSLAGLTIYAILHGIIDIDKLPGT